MGDTVVEPAPLKPTSEPTPGPSGNNGGSLLSVITEGVGELSVIDPEVAQKACQEVLEKVKLLHGGVAISSRGTPLELVNGDGVDSEIDPSVIPPILNVVFKAFHNPATACFSSLIFVFLFCFLCLASLAFF